MDDLAFLFTIALLLGGATALLRPGARNGLGFLLAFSLYGVFAAGFFLASKTVVLAAWLALAVANMAFQYRAIRRQPTAGGAPAVLVASLFLWPVQFAALRISENDEAAVERSQEHQRRRIGALPATISGTVSYTHHIGSEEGEDMVWLEEYEDLELFVTSELYDTIGIAEGRRVSLSIEEREPHESTQNQRALWIRDGSVIG